MELLKALPQDVIFFSKMRSLASREQNKKNAAYNLGVAEAVRVHKNEKPAFYVRVFSKFLLLIPPYL